MTSRRRLDDITDDQLDQLYDERDRARRIAVALECELARTEAERDMLRAECARRTEEIKSAQNASISWAERARPAEEAITRVRSLAANMRTWCSPHNIAVDYAQRIEDTLGDVEDHTGCPYCTGGPIFPRNKLVTHIHSKHAAVMELVRQGTLDKIAEGTLDQIAEWAEERAVRAEAELAAARNLAAEQADTIRRQLDHTRALADGEPHTDRERGVIQAITRVLAALDKPTDDEITALTAQTGIHTPGCTCGHNGMSTGWHLNPCPHARNAHDTTTEH